MRVSFSRIGALRALVFVSLLGREAVEASSCDCINIDTWNALKSVVQTALSLGSAGTRPHLLLCPFSITKEHADSMLEISHQIFIQCLKENDGDECVVVSRGRDCTPAMGCTHTVDITADNVWMQGFTLTGAQLGSVVVREERMGVKLIDMTFRENESPDAKEGSVVDSKLGASTHVIDSRFIQNRGTALQNRGDMMVISSKFIDNEATPRWDSFDVEEQGGGVGGAIMNSEGSSMVLTDSCFSENKAETDAPAIWSMASNVINAGGNCGRENVVIGESATNICSGIFSQTDTSCANFSACSVGECEHASSLS